MLKKEIEKTPIFDSTFHSYDFKISKKTCVNQFLTTTDSNHHPTKNDGEKSAVFFENPKMESHTVECTCYWVHLCTPVPATGKSIKKKLKIFFDDFLGG